jgi:hypothetical protein
MNLFGTTNNNLTYITHRLLAELGVKVNYSSVATYIETHPEYPALKSISDCLHHFKVPNQTLRIEKKDYWRTHLPFPFITPAVEDEDSFTLVQEIDDVNLRLATDKHQYFKLTKEEFLNTWEGVILVAEPDEESGEADFYSRYVQSLIRKATFPFLVITLFALVVFIYASLSQHVALLLPLLSCYLLPVLSWILVKPLLAKSKQLKLVLRQLNRFRYNKELFNAALHSQPHYEIKNDLKPIQLGNPAAETVLTMISNPFCQACAKLYIATEDWLVASDQLKIQVILLVNNSPQQKKVAQHMLALGFLKDEALITKALANWFQHPEQDYDTWAEQYPVAMPRKVKIALTNQFRWSQEAGISSTPILLVNGYKVPDVYTLEDLKYLIHAK